MEKRISVVIFAFLLAMSRIFSQGLTQTRSIQLCLWAEMDIYPENYSAEKNAHPDDTEFSYPIRRIKEISSHLLSGMVYGWSFSYTPSDKQMGVKEYFEKTQIKSFAEDEKKIIYKKPFIQDNKMNVWIEFYRTEAMILYLKHWNSVTHQSISGKGFAPIKDGFEGIEKACDEALKNAVREYFRTQVKNKPKEIIGKVLIRNEPKISIDSGRYCVDLDFFIETIRIIPYTKF